MADNAVLEDQFKAIQELKDSQAELGEDITAIFDALAGKGYPKAYLRKAFTRWQLSQKDPERFRTMEDAMATMDAELGLA